ncbi:hypothetical protein ABDK56_07395 [Sphingomonas sp. ASV193]|uniref:hypothetical protein n=1 Tax=Sphingomonas sp. ASV193 TaxID=3144405 RepID=UPI0032E93693
MELLLEYLFQILGEILIQALFELLAELGLHGARDLFRRSTNRFASTVLFIVWGSAAGGVSLLVLPHSAIHDPTLRLVNLLVTPILVGAAMVLIGRARAKRGQDLVGLDRFGYAFAFALSMGLVRYAWAH